MGKAFSPMFHYLLGGFCYFYGLLAGEMLFVWADKVFMSINKGCYSLIEKIFSLFTLLV